MRRRQARAWRPSGKPHGRAAQRRIGDFAPGAAAAVEQAARGQRVEGGLVSGVALRLPHDVAVPVQAQRVQLRHDGVGGARDGAGGVHVFHAQQPTPAVGARIQPTGQGSHTRARWLRAGGAGGESAYVGHSNGKRPQCMGPGCGVINAATARLLRPAALPGPGCRSRLPGSREP
ncbi:hypothetical protein G6F68_014182 [Rhizopus microsporus]|nr:hypothetical protein G6F68_014182 [Rhizopus microsporus]